MKQKASKTVRRINLWGRRHKRALLVCLLLYVAAFVTTLNIPNIRSAMPHEIMLGDKSACYVRNEVTAEKVISDIQANYAGGDGRIVRFSTKPEISISAANPFKTSSKVISEEEAAKLIIDKFDKSDSSNVTVSYISTDYKTFTPEPDYKKDETMLAGESRVEKEGADGTKAVTTLVTTVNGEKVSKQKYRSPVVDEGTPAIIYKGTLGLPDGEDWKSYDGDPVYNNADDLVATAYNYIGAPYKHGGVDLKTGVSCVGFVRAIYLKYGIKIGNSHHAMETAGIGVSYSNARKGDIICYNGHVGLYVGNGKMLDATSSRGVGVNTVRPGKIIAVRRIVQ